MYIPADIPSEKKALFATNFAAITRNTNRLFLFAADQKIEHLNADFYGSGISPDAAEPEHLFRIAQEGNIGAFATQLGLIERYGHQYPGINYIVKLNSKTNIIEQSKQEGWLGAIGNFLRPTDPISTKLWSVADVIALKHQTNLAIRGVGYTIYLGSTHEPVMLKEAASVIKEAHKEGLVAVLWIYPRGAHIADDTAFQLLAGAAGIANALGADVVKLKPPHSSDELSYSKQLQLIKKAAGNTLVIASGGKQINPNVLLERISTQIKDGHLDGVAIGRNIFQRSLQDALALTQAISAVVYDNASVAHAESVLNS